MGGLLQFAAIFIVGLAAGTGLTLWRIAPAKSKRSRSGASDDSLTARELDRLTSAGWRPVHDRALDRCNVDHIQVGPGGVFAIETKDWSGKIAVREGGKVFQNGHLRDGIARSARGAALQISQRVSAKGAKPDWVHAVVVFWGDFPQGMVEQEKVTYLSGDRLVEWLRSRPARLNGVEIDEFVAVVSTMRPGVELSLAS